mgnify:FL=1
MADSVNGATAEQAAVVAETRIGGYATSLRFAAPHDAHLLSADQPADADGGTGEGPNPFSYLFAALASCTGMTVRSYAARKEMGLERVEVSIRPHRPEGKKVESIEIGLRFEGDLSEDDRKKLVSAAASCPVRKLLESGVSIEEREVS